MVPRYLPSSVVSLNSPPNSPVKKFSEMVSREESKDALFIASKRGQYEVVEILLKQGRFDINSVHSNFKRTSLHAACRHGHANIVDLLLRAGADPVPTDTKMITPMHFAASNGHEDVLKVMLKARIDVAPHDREGCSPLHGAAKYGHSGVVRLLLDAGAEASSRKLLTPSLQPSSYTTSKSIKAYEVLKEIDIRESVELTTPKGIVSPRQFIFTDAFATSEDGILARLIDGRGWICLTSEDGKKILRDMTSSHVLESNSDFFKNLYDEAALAAGRLKVTRVQLEGELDEALKAMPGATALCLAACEGHVDTVNILVQRGADLEMSIEGGWTPLILAAYHGHTAVVRSLIKAGANVFARTKNGSTALCAGAIRGYVDVVKELVRAKAAIAYTLDNRSPNPISAAALNGHVEIVRFLAGAGGEVSAVGEDGWAPLHWAAFHGHTEVIVELLERGADWSVIGVDGWTALNLAAAQGHADVVRALVSKGADKSIANVFGSTPRMNAAEHGYYEVVRELLDNRASVKSTKVKGAEVRAGVEVHAPVKKRGKELPPLASSAVDGMNDVTKAFYSTAISLDEQSELDDSFAVENSRHVTNAKEETDESVTVIDRPCEESLITEIDVDHSQIVSADVDHSQIVSVDVNHSQIVSIADSAIPQISSSDDKELDKTTAKIIAKVPRIPVGATVTVVDNFTAIGHAAKGPLSLGELAELLQDDNDHQPYKVRATTGARVGDVYWYEEAALRVVETLAKDKDSYTAITAAGDDSNAEVRPSNILIGSSTCEEEIHVVSSTDIEGGSISLAPVQTVIDSVVSMAAAAGELFISPLVSDPLQSTTRIPVGAIVTVTHNYQSIGRAASGPLSMGDRGELLQDDKDHQPYKVRATTGARVGDVYWYEEAALRVVSDAAQGEKTLTAITMAGDDEDIGPAASTGGSNAPLPGKSEVTKVDGIAGTELETALAGDGASEGANLTSAVVEEIVRETAPRIPVGAIVTVVDNFAVIGHAAKGPLSLGELAELLQDDNDHQPYKVRATTGARVGDVYWYEEAALRIVRDAVQVQANNDVITVVADSKEEEAAAADQYARIELTEISKLFPGPTQEKTLAVQEIVLTVVTEPSRIPVGATVTVVDNFAAIGHAAKGPLSLGELAELLQDDNDHQPYKVRATTGARVGDVYWYEEAALRAVD